jgi:alpha-beta hydrolase superfamily lysophospholipase
LATTPSLLDRTAATGAEDDQVGAGRLHRRAATHTHVPTLVVCGEKDPIVLQRWGQRRNALRCGTHASQAGGHKVRAPYNYYIAHVRTTSATV